MQVISLNAFVIMIAAAPLSPAQAQSYTFHRIDVPHEDGTVARDLPANTLIGLYQDSGAIQHCFTLRMNVITTLLDPKSTQTQCYGTNIHGVIVGSYPFASFSNGFAYSNGTYTDVIVPTATAGTIAYGISDASIIVGQFSDNAGTHGFSYDGATYLTIDVPGMPTTLAISVNIKGQMVFQCFDSGGVLHSFLYSGGKYSELLVAGGNTVAGHGINNKGQVAMSYVDGSGVEHGAVYDSSKKVTYLIDVPGASLTSVVGIGDNDVLVGRYQVTGSTVNHGFKAIGTL